VILITIDGIDECTNEERKRVLSAIQQLIGNGTTVVKVLFSSREEVDIAKALERYPRINVTGQAISPDITQYVKDTVHAREQSGDLVVGNSSLIEEITNALINGAHGLYVTNSSSILPDG
jgi:hypothetical protein